MTDAPRLFGNDHKRRTMVRTGLNTTVNAWRAAGMIEPADQAWIKLCRVLADELDAAISDRDESRYTVGALSGRYRDALADLAERMAPTDDDDAADLAALFAAIPDAPAD